MYGKTGFVLFVLLAGVSPATAQVRSTADRPILQAVRASGTSCQPPAGEDAGAAMPPTVEWRRDINGDGRPEALVVEGNVYCYGNTGQGFWMLTQRPDGAWAIVANEHGIATLLKTTGPAGWPDLEVGGPGFCFPVLRWNGGRYQLHRQAYDGKPCGDVATSAAPAATAAPTPVRARSARAGTVRKSASSRPAPAPAARPAPLPVLPPFDVALANPAPPLGTSAVWTGIAMVSATPSVVTAQIVNANGRLSGTASVRATTSGQAATLPIEGRVKDGICQIKIESLSSFKGNCNSAGFIGWKRFLGTVDASMFVYTGGAEAMARAGRALPAQLAYGGKSVSISGAFPMNQFIIVDQANGVLSGMHMNHFTDDNVVGAAFDGSCVIVSSGVTSFQGICNGSEFRGMGYDAGKPGTTIALRTLSSQERAAALAARQRLAQTATTTNPPPIAAQPRADLPPAAPPTVLATGRARLLVEPGGGCGPEAMLRRGYCFDEAIDRLRRDPAMKDIAVIASRTRLPLGARIGNGQYDYVTVKRGADGTFVADKTLRGTAKLRMPPGCMWRATLNEGFVIALAEGGKRAIEVADYVCG